MSINQKIVVGLDLVSGVDKTVINYAHYMTSLLKPKELEFLYVEGKLQIPKELLKQFPELEENIEKTFEDKMSLETSAFDLSSTKVDLSVIRGESPLKEFIKKTHKEDVGLVIAGRKKSLKQSELMPQKLSRKVNSDMLLVPEGAKPFIKKILVAIDFSEHSKDALDSAISLAKVSNAEIVCLHQFEVPNGYTKIGKSFDEFASIMQGHAEKENEEFMKKVDTAGVKISTIYDSHEDKDVADALVEKAKELKIDLIVIGARGRTDIAAFFLGSVTEDLINTDNTIPMLLVKKKGSTMDFWDAFKELQE